MISVKRYCATAAMPRGEDVTYDLRKGEVLTRLSRAIAHNEEDFSADDLARLDAGLLPESRLARLFTHDELRSALQRRIGALASEQDALQRMMHRLPGDPSGEAGGVRRAQIGGPEQETLFGD